MFDAMPIHDVIMWNALIGGYAESGDDLHAVSLFLLMQEQDVEPDQATYTILLKGRQSATSAVDRGRLVHNSILSGGFESSTIVGSALIDMYVKCNSTEDAYAVFERLPIRDVVTWGAMIAGFIYQGQAQDAVKLSRRMRLERIELNPTTFAAILKACSSIAALVEGRLIHTDVLKSGYESDVYVASATIDMFAKCGSLPDARRLFDRLPVKDVGVWNAMIAGCAELGDFASAVQYYEDMQSKGVKPDDATFTSLLSASCHLGLVSEGCYHFNLLQVDNDMEPTIDHYNGVTDLLGRAGHLEEAGDLLHMMPFRENLVGWLTLLGHCQTHGDLEQGERCFRSVISADPNNGSAYVLMSRIYTRAGRQEDARRLENIRLSSTAWKKPGQAFVEVNNEVHDFVAGDKDNVERYRDVYRKLDRLRMRMEEDGYTPLMERWIRDDDAILSCG
jgi:pentatricopeptide repeat protein